MHKIPFAATSKLIPSDLSADDWARRWGRLCSVDTQKALTVELLANEVVLGRALTAAVRLEEPGISPVHCIIRRERRGDRTVYSVEDTSLSGTFVNQMRIGGGKRFEVFNGDCVYLVPERSDAARVGFELQVLESDGAARRKRREEDQEPPATYAKRLMKLDEELGSEIICCICYDVLYDCVSLVPCMHNFCGGCLWRWLDHDARRRDFTCPHCREPASTVAKNHAINNITKAFLDAHPEKRRGEGECRALDEKSALLQQLVLERKEIDKLILENESLLDEDFGLSGLYSDSEEMIAPSAEWRGSQDAPWLSPQSEGEAGDESETFSESEAEAGPAQDAHE